MVVFLILYGVALAVGFAIVAARPDYAGNVGFLVLGAFAGIYPAFLIEQNRRKREADALKVAVFHELVNRVGRCCFDFENPWHPYLQQPDNRSVTWLLKFTPEPPTVYPAVAARIGDLPGNAAQAVIDFYIAVGAWRAEIQNQAADFQAKRADVNHGSVRLLARRLRRTLPPGKRALEALAPHVPNADEIERNAMRDGDELYPEAHPNAGKTFRERIAIMLANTKE